MINPSIATYSSLQDSLLSINKETVVQFYQNGYSSIVIILNTPHYAVRIEHIRYLFTFSIIYLYNIFEACYIDSMQNTKISVNQSQQSSIKNKFLIFSTILAALAFSIVSKLYFDIVFAFLKAQSLFI